MLVFGFALRGQRVGVEGRRGRMDPTAHGRDVNKFQWNFKTVSLTRLEKQK